MGVLIIIEEDAGRRDQLAALARGMDFDVLTASTGAEGAALIKRQASSLVFVSASMPDLSGYELASRMAYDYSVAFVLMVDRDKDVGRSMLLSKGVIEFIYRPITAVEFTARVHRAQEISTMLRVRERLVFELDRLSQTDGLTGLLNARVFFKQLKLTARVATDEGQALSILMIDLDHFKRLNDTLGHSVGNDVLQEVGSILLARLKSGQQAFRYGGEEFAILLPKTEKEAAMRFAEMLRMEIETMGEMKYHKSPVTASIGVAQLAAGETPEAFVARVDVTMYSAKNAGRNRVIVADAAEE